MEMVQASQKPVMITLVICTLVLLLAGFMAYSNASNQADLAQVELNAKIDGAVAEVSAIDIPVAPTAAEIAALIDVPTSSTSGAVSDIFDEVYSDEVNDLEGLCISGLQAEFNEDDVLEDLEDLIEADLGEEIENLTLLEDNFDDNYKFTVINLGLDDFEDSEASIYSELKVSYTTVFGSDEVITIKVLANAQCSDYDGTLLDGEFEDLSVDYVLA